MDVYEIAERFEKMAVMLYQEHIQDGLSYLEQVVADSLAIFAEENPIVSVMDAIDRADYVQAADVLHYEMYLPVKAVLEEEA